MPIFEVHKSQDGQDAHGDSFSWEKQTWYVSAESREVLQSCIYKVGRIEINSKEYLILTLGDEVQNQEKGRPLRNYLDGYNIPIEILAQV